MAEVITSEKSTARKGNPRQASRGAAVDRAKQSLGNLIESKITPTFEQQWWVYLGGIIGVAAGEAEARLDTATLEELEVWMSRVRGG